MMDPQVCLQDIVDAYRSDDRLELDAAMYTLADWLRYGGFPPIAAGMLFADETQEQPVTCVMDSQGVYRLQAAQPAGQPDVIWTLQRYDRSSGQIVESWPLPNHH